MSTLPPMSAKPGLVQAISTARTNGELVAQLASLYCHGEIHAFDPTYGRGGMWTHWKPTTLVTSDLDFTKCYLSMRQFDLIIFDPPYVAKGGNATKASVADHDDRYGRSGRGTHESGRKTGLTPDEVRRLMLAGMANLAPLVRRKGMLWVKSADYVTSGRVQWGTHDVRVQGRALGLVQIDEVHLRSTSPQPDHARQCHARRGYSTMTVWRKS